jgi:hypothetical protein
MIPTCPPDFHGSVGEEKVFRALHLLENEIVVIHSYRWLHSGRRDSFCTSAQGEGDFVVFDPSNGILVIEVKGGEVWCESGEWRQRNRKTGKVNTIYPEKQASDTVHRIRNEIVSRIPDARSILVCHAVWFPDGIIDRKILPMNYHAATTLDQDDINSPRKAINGVFKYWQSILHKKNDLNSKSFKRILATLAPSLSVVRSMRQAIEEREELFVQLTREQVRVIEFLDEQEHAAIVGAAGTGKTLLAVEKARRLSSPKETVLFLCYNAALRDHLEDSHAQPNVRYLTFHGFAREITGQAVDFEESESKLLEYLSEDAKLPYSHLVIDEGQDFKREWLEYLYYRFRNNAFYVFYDRYQAIQGEKDPTWLNELPCRLVLTRNCRNTEPIARSAYRMVGASIPPTLNMVGPRPTLYCVSDDVTGVNIVRALVKVAISKYQVLPTDIAILTLETLTADAPWCKMDLGGLPTSEKPLQGHVTLSTVRKYKGLEATLIIVVDADFRGAVNPDWRQRFYVACSRARHAVHIVTDTVESDLREALIKLSGTDKVRPSWRALSRQIGLTLGGNDYDPFKERGVG